MACAEEVLRQLDLHYRAMSMLCAGTWGFSAQKPTTSRSDAGSGPGRKKQRRVQGNLELLRCGDFQARRMMRAIAPPTQSRVSSTAAERPGTAVGRALIADGDLPAGKNGSIAVPDVLQPYGRAQGDRSRSDNVPLRARRRR